MNAVDRSIIKNQRGCSREWVFPCNGTAMHQMNDSAWKKITSHYSGAELGKLIEAANMVSTTDSRGPVLTILKRRIG